MSGGGRQGAWCCAKARRRGGERARAKGRVDGAGAGSREGRQGGRGLERGAIGDERQNSNICHEWGEEGQEGLRGGLEARDVEGADVVAQLPRDQVGSKHYAVERSLKDVTCESKSVRLGGHGKALPTHVPETRQAESHPLCCRKSAPVWQAVSSQRRPDRRLEISPLRCQHLRQKRGTAKRMVDDAECRAEGGGI